MQKMMQPLYSQQVIANRVEKLADELNKKYKDESNVHMVVTLNGAFIFAADLIRKLKFPVTLCFAGSVTSNVQQVGDTRINSNALPKSFGNEPVIVLEDIIDSGKTIAILREMIASKFASSIDIVALVKRQSCKIAPDYACFTVPEGMFLVGYGLDLENRYRELPGIFSIDCTMEKSTGVC
jgi:hypoxanthine phosphoribosyltransferase